MRALFVSPRKVERRKKKENKKKKDITIRLRSPRQGSWRSRMTAGSDVKPSKVQDGFSRKTFHCNKPALGKCDLHARAVKVTLTACVCLLLHLLVYRCSPFKPPSAPRASWRRLDVLLCYLSISCFLDDFFPNHFPSVQPACSCRLICLGRESHSTIDCSAALALDQSLDTPTYMGTNIYSRFLLTLRRASLLR